MEITPKTSSKKKMDVEKTAAPTKKRKMVDSQTTLVNPANEGRVNIFVGYPSEQSVVIANEMDKSVFDRNELLYSVKPDLQREKIEKKAKTNKKIVEEHFYLYVIFHKDMFMKQVKLEKGYYMIRFPTISITIANVLISAEIKFETTLDIAIQYLNTDGLAYLAMCVFDAHLLGPGGDYYSFHPSHVPSIQFSLKYLSGIGVYTQQNALEKTKLEEIQDTLYPDFENYRLLKTNKLSDPLKQVTLDQYVIIMMYFVNLLQEMLDQIKNKKKGYDQDTLFEDILYNIISLSISIGKK